MNRSINSINSIKNKFNNESEIPSLQYKTDNPDWFCQKEYRVILRLAHSNHPRLFTILPATNPPKQIFLYDPDNIGVYDLTTNQFLYLYDRHGIDQSQKLYRHLHQSQINHKAVNKFLKALQTGVSVYRDSLVSFSRDKLHKVFETIKTEPGLNQYTEPILPNDFNPYNLDLE